MHNKRQQRIFSDGEVFMKIKTFLVYMGLFAGAFAFSMTGYISGTRDARESTVRPAKALEQKVLPAEDSVGAKADAPKIAEISKEKYILRSNENKVSLFIRYSNGDEQIHSEYEIPVNLLPKSDREKLEKGIEFDSIADIIRFIEDYMG